MHPLLKTFKKFRYIIYHRTEHIEHWIINKCNHLWMSSCLCSVFPPLLTSLSSGWRRWEDHLGPFAQDSGAQQWGGNGHPGPLVASLWPQIRIGWCHPKKIKSDYFSWRIFVPSPWLLVIIKMSLSWLGPGCTELLSPLARARDHQHREGKERNEDIPDPENN